MKRTAKPTAESHQCVPQGLETHGSNFGVVVGGGCAFCARHPERYGKGGKGADRSGGVDSPQAFFARGRKNGTIHIKHNHALCTRLA